MDAGHVRECPNEIRSGLEGSSRVRSENTDRSEKQRAGLERTPRGSFPKSTVYQTSSGQVINRV